MKKTVTEKTQHMAIGMVIATILIITAVAVSIGGVG